MFVLWLGALLKSGEVAAGAASTGTWITAAIERTIDDTSNDDMIGASQCYFEG